MYRTGYLNFLTCKDAGHAEDGEKYQGHGGLPDLHLDQRQNLTRHNGESKAGNIQQALERRDIMERAKQVMTNQTVICTIFVNTPLSAAAVVARSAVT